MSSSLHVLEWGPVDFERGLGGVEVHVRSLARELRALGHSVELAQESSGLLKLLQWMERTREVPPFQRVCHTHGSGVSLDFFRVFWRRPRPFLWVHTAHGRTWDRMKACGEWTYLGGYLAHVREELAWRLADVVLPIHGDFPEIERRTRLSLRTEVCGNGWDSWGAGEERRSSLEVSTLLQVGFLGRASDRVKGRDRLDRVEELLRDAGFQWKGFEAPGGGGAFQSVGELQAEGVKEFLEKIDVLVIPSRYEGLPLVALEALALGTQVVATNVGGLKALGKLSLKGLVLVSSLREEDVAAGIAGALREQVKVLSPEARKGASTQNQSVLDSWNTVARRWLSAVG